MTKASILELLTADRKQRFREQRGSVVKRPDGFYIRFYQDRDGVRTKITERLCDLDTTAAKVKLLQRSHMSAVNNIRHEELQSPTQAPPITIGGFWTTVYWPWAEANKRESTQRGYQYVWKLYVAPELETRTFETYTTVDACELLDQMAKRLNKNSLSHVKSLCSGIFSQAVRKGIIKINPWREAKESVNVRKPKPRVKYTVEETAAILNTLDKPDAKLFFALCAVLALRPEEAAAVKWENIDLINNVLKVREAAPYGKLGPLKTEQSAGDLPIIEPVRSFIEAWHNAMGKPSVGFLFTANGVDPVNHNNFAKYRIKPQALKACPRWAGCYSGRHGAATRLLNLTGDVRAAYQVLRNSLAVVIKTYVEPDKAAGKVGLDASHLELSKELNKGEQP